MHTTYRTPGFASRIRQSIAPYCNPHLVDLFAYRRLPRFSDLGLRWLLLNLFESIYILDYI